MSSDDDPRKTVAISTQNVVVVVATSDQLAVVSEMAAKAASRAAITRVPIAKVNDAAASLRPYAIVVEEHLYEFAAADLDALARDVGAVLISCSASVALSVLKASLEEAAQRARR